MQRMTQNLGDLSTAISLNLSIASIDRKQRNEHWLSAISLVRFATGLHGHFGWVANRVRTNRHWVFTPQPTSGPHYADELPARPNRGVDVPRGRSRAVGSKDLQYAGESNDCQARVPPTTRHALAELLGKRDDDALRPADVG
jgi:hypothetical protein